MKFTVLRESLRSALDNIKATIRPIGGVECSRLVKFEAAPQEITLTGYDMETGITAAVNADTTDSGEFTVSLEKLTALAAKLSEEIMECSVEGGIMTIKCGRSKVRIPAAEADLYPDIPSFDSDSCFTVNGETLSDMIRQTVFAVSARDDKPILKGELFDIRDNGFNLVAVDGYRLALRTEPAATADTYRFAVKGDTLKAVSRLAKGDVTLIPSKRHIVFDFGSTKLFSRLLEGDFINYGSTIPNDHSAEAIVPARPLTECLERFFLLIDDKIKVPLRCAFGNGRLDMFLKTEKGEMSDYVDIDFSGTPTEIGFNVRFLLDTLKACESDKTRFRLNGSLKPMKVLPIEGNAYTYLVLPVRLKKE